MRQIFYNDSINQLIEKNGYAVIPFLKENTIEKLKRFYSQLPAANNRGTHVTMFNPSYEYRKTVDNGIKELCAAEAENLMNGYRTLYTNYMIKESGPEGDFPVHQDWTYVDENNFTSIALWIPLQDVNAENGALQVVKGSHKFITKLRGPYVHEPFQKISNLIQSSYSTSANLRAGEALVWDHRLIHFSLPNKTSNPRLAFTLIMVPRRAEIFHCFRHPDSPENKIEIYEVDTDFFMRYEISKPPTGVPLKKTVLQEISDFSQQDFIERYNCVNSYKPNEFYTTS